MAEWKVIVGKEKKTIKAIGKATESRNVEYYQIITHDGNTFVIGDYEVVDVNNIEMNSKGELPGNIVLIDGIHYEPRGSQKYMTDLNGIINVFIRDWKIAKPEYDITDMKLATQYFKELINIKNEILKLK